MTYKVDGYGPSTWNIAESRGHWDTRSGQNRFPSGFFHWNFV